MYFEPISSIFSHTCTCTQIKIIFWYRFKSYWMRKIHHTSGFFFLPFLLSFFSHFILWFWRKNSMLFCVYLWPNWTFYARLGRCLTFAHRRLLNPNITLSKKQKLTLILTLTTFRVKVSFWLGLGLHCMLGLVCSLAVCKCQTLRLGMLC